MWFKNLKLFQLLSEFKESPEELEEKLLESAFKPCSAGQPMSTGFISPINTDGAPLVHGAMGRLLICYNIEEKLLPATVVRQHTDERVKELESLEDRNLSKREKASIKDQIYFTLVQQAFTRSTKIYAYFDVKNKWLLVNTTNNTKLELFIASLKKALPNIELSVPETKNIPNLMSRWLLSGQYPDMFEVESTAKLEDFNDTKRVISCKNQDLFNDNITNLIKDGCMPKQISLTWQQRVTFNLNHDFTLSSLKYDDALITEAKDNAGESEAERFDADYFIMSETLEKLMLDLLEVITESEPKSKKSNAAETA